MHSSCTYQEQQLADCTGFQIEEPFSVLPLDVLAQRLRLDILEMMEHGHGAVNGLQAMPASHPVLGYIRPACYQHGSREVTIWMMPAANTTAAVLPQAISPEEHLDDMSMCCLSLCREQGCSRGMPSPAWQCNSTQATAHGQA